MRSPYSPEIADHVEVSQAAVVGMETAAPREQTHRNRLGLALLAGLAVMGVPGLAMAQAATPPSTSISKPARPAKASKVKTATDTTKTTPTDPCLNPTTPSQATQCSANSTVPPVPGHGTTTPAPSLFDTPNGTPGPTNVNVPHENLDLRLHPVYDVGSRFQMGSGNHNFGILDAGVSQRFGWDYQNGDWTNHLHLQGRLDGQTGFTLTPGAGFGGNLTGRLQLDDSVTRNLGSGYSLSLNPEIGVQGGFGTQFDRESPLNRWDVGGSLLLNKNFGTSTLYGGPFATYVGDFSGRDSHTDAGGRLGYSLQVDEQNRLQVEGRVWNENHPSMGNFTDYGTYLQWDHKSDNQKATISPFVGYQNVGGDHQVVGGLTLHF